jgi:hypothetical protein
MNYEKLTPEKFTEKLKGGSYESLTGARRAIGKASWPETQKATARTAAEKFFGGAATAKPAKAAAPKKQAAAKAKVKTGGTVVKAAAESKAPKAKKIAKQARKASQAAAPASEGFSMTGKQLTLADVRKNPFQVIQLSEHCVASGTGVLNALTAMKAQNPELDVTEPTQAAVTTIRNGLELASKVIQSLSEGMEIPKAITESLIANGATPSESAVPGEPIYTSPTAEA